MCFSFSESDQFFKNHFSVAFAFPADFAVVYPGHGRRLSMADTQMWGQRPVQVSMPKSEGSQLSSPSQASIRSGNDIIGLQFENCYLALLGGTGEGWLRVLFPRSPTFCTLLRPSGPVLNCPLESQHSSWRDQKLRASSLQDAWSHRAWPAAASTVSDYQASGPSAQPLA